MIKYVIVVGAILNLNLMEAIGYGVQSIKMIKEYLNVLNQLHLTW